MKILICGKGGSGKSTLSVLIARSLKNRGYRVLLDGIKKRVKGRIKGLHAISTLLLLQLKNSSRSIPCS